MIKDVSELKELIQWCKKEKVRALSVNGIQFELSDMALVQDILEDADMTAPKSKPDPKNDKEISHLSTDSLIDTSEPSSKAEQDELLYFSAN